MTMQCKTRKTNTSIEINIHEKELCVKLVIYKACISSKPAHQTVIYTEWHIPDILIQLIFLMMGTWLPKICRE